MNENSLAKIFKISQYYLYLTLLPLLSSKALQISLWNPPFMHVQKILSLMAIIVIDGYRCPLMDSMPLLASINSIFRDERILVMTKKRRGKLSHS